MEELRIVFIVAGAFAIFGIIGHGLWTIRKNTQVKKSLAAELLPPEEKAETVIDSDDPLLDQNIDFQPSSREEPVIDDLGVVDTEDGVNGNVIEEPENYDDLGLGAVRVVTQESTTENSNIEQKYNLKTEGLSSDSSDKVPEANQTKSDKLFEKAPEYDMRLSRADRNDEWVDSSMPPPPSSLMKGDLDEQQKDIAHDIGEVVPTVEPEAATQPDTILKAEINDDTPIISEPKVEEPEETKDEPVTKPSLAEQAKNLVKRKKSTSIKRKEPKLSDDQMSIDFDDEPATIDESETIADDTTSSEPVEQEVLVLNVKAEDGASIPGAALLPMLLTLGFKFGDQDIFHRHVNSNGKGPVLFSLANMFKPGIFDIDNLENFSTQGISLFMILPIEGDAHQVFNMMHNAARKISDEFGAQVLDGRRSRLNKQSLQQYVEKIREFERKRMIRRH
jgi:cell division protein ZipA